MNVRSIKIDSYDYPLADDKIALHPLAERDSCKLLVANGEGRITHSVFSNLPLFLAPETLVVANETKVIRARMEFVKESGARIEIFLLEPLRPAEYVENFASFHECEWSCMVGNRKRWKSNPLTKTLDMEGKKVTLSAYLGEELPGNSLSVRFSWDDPRFSFAEIIEEAGNIPIPPYLKRESEESDSSDYQTVYSRIEGSVAAPTAGLHFTPGLIEELKRRGDEFTAVTLHVGAGTFQPVKSEEIGGHPMHTEWISVSARVVSRVVSALENGRDILAVGTTTVRTLESLPYLGVLAESGEKHPEVTQWMPYEEKFRRIDTIRALKSLLRYMRENELGELQTRTSIMIAPGFRWRVVNRLVTNFHQPKSTLLLLVSSFLGSGSDGREVWRKVYEEALRENYRFLSYGDACLFSRGAQKAELPLAKSMVIRAATITAVREPEKLKDFPFYGLCDDSEHYLRALRMALASVGLPAGEETEIYIGEGAAPLRFLTAFAASLQGTKLKITAAEGLRKRPISSLISALRSIGADIEFSDADPDWCIRIRGRRLEGGLKEIDSSFTSQFVSALLLASPLWERGLCVDTAGVAVSKPYLMMTEKMMAEKKVDIEADWSAAAFFYEYCLITGKAVAIGQLCPPQRSLQGDSAACMVFSRIGVDTAFHDDGSASLQFNSHKFDKARGEGVFGFDFTDYPDMVPSVAVALCYRRLPFRFTGVHHLRFKECDRLSALQSLLVRLGYEVSATDDSLEFTGEFKPLTEFPLDIDPYGDHRMAMAFYPLERLGMVRIEDKSVVSKSFPDFYQQF